MHLADGSSHAFDAARPARPKTPGTRQVIAKTLTRPARFGYKSLAHHEGQRDPALRSPGNRLAGRGKVPNLARHDGDARGR